MSGQELVARVNRAFTKTMLIANGVGGLLVLVFLTLVLPVAHPPPVRTVVLLNWPPAIVSLAVASYLAPRWGRSIAAPSLQWLASGAALSRANASEATCWQIGEQRVLRGRLEPTVLAAPLTSAVAATSP